MSASTIKQSAEYQHKRHSMRSALFALVSIFTFGAVHLLLSKVTVGSESVKPYLLLRTAGIPKQGDYVTFPFSHPMIHTRAEFWVKFLACNEGQLLERSNDQFFCDGKYFADARLHSKKGELLPQFSYDGQIPEGMAFVLGDGQNSFDSRHFGLVSNKQMVVNRPIL
ncbi:MAG: type IV secretory pathway protease TraF [Anaerolineae bacterium]|nr:type IV secretory pathway protease TraF [Anaerolineae bacterium]